MSSDDDSEHIDCEPRRDAGPLYGLLTRQPHGDPFLSFLCNQCDHQKMKYNSSAIISTVSIQSMDSIPIPSTRPTYSTRAIFSMWSMFFSALLCATISLQKEVEAICLDFTQLRNLRLPMLFSFSYIVQTAKASSLTPNQIKLSATLDFFFGIFYHTY